MLADATPCYSLVFTRRCSAVPLSAVDVCVCVCVYVCVCVPFHIHTHTPLSEGTVRNGAVTVGTTKCKPFVGVVWPPMGAGTPAGVCMSCGHTLWLLLVGVATRGSGYASERVHVLWPRLPPSCTHPQETGLRVHDKRAHNAHGFATRTPQFVPKRRQARSSSPWGCVHTKVWTRQGFRELFFEHDYCG